MKKELTHSYCGMLTLFSCKKIFDDRNCHCLLIFLIYAKAIGSVKGRCTNMAEEHQKMRVRGSADVEN